MYKLLTSARRCDDLSIGFDGDRYRRQRELTDNKNIKRKIHVRIMLKDIFGFAGHQEKGTYGLSYKLTFTRNTDSAALKKGNTINNGKIKFIAIEWYVPHSTPSITQQQLFLNQIKKKMATELHYPERPVVIEEVNIQYFSTLELGTQEGVNIPVWIFTVFRKSDREHYQNLNNDTFCRVPVTSAQVVIGTEKYLDSGNFFQL